MKKLTGGVAMQPIETRQDWFMIFSRLTGGVAMQPIETQGSMSPLSILLLTGGVAMQPIETSQKTISELLLTGGVAMQPIETGDGCHFNTTHES